MKEMNYSYIVKTEELKIAKTFLENILGALTTDDIVKPEIHCISQDWGKLQTGVSVTRRPLCLKGKIYSTGLGTHAESKILIRLPRRILRITGLCGVDDNPETRKNSRSLVFSIEMKERKIWESNPLSVDSEPAEIDIPANGIQEFFLCVRGPITYAHADWVNLRAYLENGKIVEIGKPEYFCGFGFYYDDRHSTEFFHNWKIKEKSCKEENGIICHTITKTDPQTSLDVICEIKEYTKFPVIEWRLKFENRSNRTTPLLRDVKSLDTTFNYGIFPYLHYWTGDYAQPDGYEPFCVSLAHQEIFNFSPVGGRPTNRAWPYFNLEWQEEHRGIIVAIGWPGQWLACFEGKEDGAVHISAGQQNTHFKLLSGEHIYSPTSVLMFYQGDFNRSQNLWRRWMMAHNMPRMKGKLPSQMLAAYCGKVGTSEMALETEKSQIQSFNMYRKRGIKLDLWWIDAGWYPCNGIWYQVGTWDVDKKRFPGGIRAISDYCRKKQVKTIVWFEPERVYPETWLWNHHPEWLLKSTKNSNRLLNLGNTDARKWLTNHIIQFIKKHRINVYRQDFNIDPLPFWKENDTPDRQGITENHYVEGYLTFWNELRTKIPDLLIDSCASGGRRNDLETMKLAVPLHKTDYNYADNDVKQAFHYSLYQWFPYFGALLWPFDNVDSYAFFSSIAPATVLNYDPANVKLDWKLLKNLTEKWRAITNTLYFYTDYYPLTPYSRDDDDWIAWQFHNPEKHEGIIQAFRRRNCKWSSICLKLQGLEQKLTYTISEFEPHSKTKRISGKKLMESGITIFSRKTPEAKILIYRKD